MAIHKLTAKQVETTKPDIPSDWSSGAPGAKPKYLTDGAGLRLRITPYRLGARIEGEPAEKDLAVDVGGEWHRIVGGKKEWLYRYRVGQKAATYMIGVYPAVSLKEAREKLLAARVLVQNGQNPSLVRKTTRHSNITSQANTFGVVAGLWLKHNTGAWSDTHLARTESLLRRIALPQLGGLPIADITTHKLEKVSTDFYDSGRKDSARKLRSIFIQIWEYAISERLVESNPAKALSNSSRLKPAGVKPHKVLSKLEVGKFLRSLDEDALAGRRSSPVVRTAILIAMMTGHRDAALRGARWQEFDLDAGLWSTPRSRMKRKKIKNMIDGPFETPLPRQGVELLKELKKLTYANGESFVFAGRREGKPLSANTLTQKIQDLGFDATVHGMRGLMTNVLNEAQFNWDAIERQLDHIEKDKVRGAYLTTEFAEYRRTMIQWYADWMDAKRANKPDPLTLHAPIPTTAPEGANA